MGVRRVEYTDDGMNGLLGLNVDRRETDECNATFDLIPLKEFAV
jgi:hypothetical protein